MIIWLNGTFGVGKTSTADRLAALIPDGRVFDPETVGAMLRANLADRPVSDFQDWPAWPPLVAATLIEIARLTGQNVIAPQTVLKRERLDQVLVPLRVAGLEVFQVLLDADEAVLRSRINGSDDASAWRLDHLDEYKAARPWMAEMADLVVDTAARTPPQIARRILAGLPDLGGKAVKVVKAGGTGGAGGAKAGTAAGPGAAAKPDGAAEAKDSAEADGTAEAKDSAEANGSAKADATAMVDGGVKADGANAGGVKADGGAEADGGAKADGGVKCDGGAEADGAAPGAAPQRETALADT